MDLEWTQSTEEKSKSTISFVVANLHTNEYTQKVRRNMSCAATYRHWRREGGSIMATQTVPIPVKMRHRLSARLRSKVDGAELSASNKWLTDPELDVGEVASSGPCRSYAMGRGWKRRRQGSAASRSPVVAFTPRKMNAQCRCAEWRQVSNLNTMPVWIDEFIDLPGAAVFAWYLVYRGDKLWHLAR